MQVTVDKYEILEEIGRGGMATVYRARDLRLDRLVALKIMHPHLQGTLEARTRFAREARTVAKLKHPNILEIYDYSGDDSSTSYISAELLTGPTLKLFGDEHSPMMAEFVACIGLQLAQALSTAHEVGVIHRDVKPENVLIHQNRLVKLTDFGVAHMVDSHAMTATGQLLGSPGHMAPEQLEGQTADARSDLFSLGTVLYFLAVGELPFAGRNPGQVLKRVLEGQYTDPLRANPALGAKFAGILRKLLERDRNIRYENAHYLIVDLTQFLQESGVQEPHAYLEKYFHDSEATTIQLKAQVIERSLVEGDRFAKTGHVVEALDHYNRVLALDAHQVQAFEGVQRLGQRHKKKRAAKVVLIATLLCATGVAGWFAVERYDAEVSKEGALTGKKRNQTAKPKKVEANKNTLPRSVGAGTHIANKENAKAQVRNPASMQARRVVFRPFPQNVTIAVDDAPARAYGPSFREVELSAGEHRFTVEGGFDCCVDRTFEYQIAEGPGTTTLPLRLELRPAQVYVRSDVPGQVVLENGRALGKTHSLIQVPMKKEPSFRIGITVTAPGYPAYSSRLNVRAGQLSELDVTFKPKEAS